MTHVLTVERALDVRKATPLDAASDTLARFDSLDPGERLVLVSGDSGAGSLELLQSQRAGAFEWSPLEQGPLIWRTEIMRRDVPARTARGVAEALSWDHDRLDALEAAAFAARADGDFPAAYDLYAEFALGLRRHIAFEEKLLFPEFEGRMGMPQTSGPTAVMRSEHRDIERRLEALAAAIGDAAAEVDMMRASLHAVLLQHNVKEERVLYPMTDQLMGVEDANSLVARIQRFGS